MFLHLLLQLPIRWGRGYNIKKKDVCLNLTGLYTTLYKCYSLQYRTIIENGKISYKTKNAFKKAKLLTKTDFGHQIFLNRT